MLDEGVKARCNLFGVLKNIEYLVENDKISRDLVKGVDLAIQFNIANGPKANLAFKQGKAEMKAGKHKCQLKLGFTSPKHFNKMIEGKANPIPLKGLSKIGFLTGTFTQLADRLSFYLQPTEENLKKGDFFQKNTEMTAYAAMFSVAEIGNFDSMGQANASKIPNGVIQVAINGSVGVQILVQDGIMCASKGYSSNPRSILSFSSIDVAHQILNGKMDTFTAMALGDMEMSGYIPMLEYMNPILDLVAKYLG